jgi:hypothetical protein
MNGRSSYIRSKRAGTIYVRKKWDEKMHGRPM